MSTRNMLLWICSWAIIRMGSTEVLSSAQSHMNWTKQIVKLLEEEIQTCVTIATTSCKKDIMVSQLGVVQKTLKLLEFELTDCYTNSQEYTGKRNTTKSGLVCQHWSSNDPHEHAHYKFPDGSVDDAKNYCRDPVGSGMPWCLTVDPNTRAEDCRVPRCGSL